MAGAVIKSLLKESIKNLPENYARKSGTGATADLLKKGVKAEELEYAAMQLPEGKITKQDLVKAEEGRKDWFQTEVARGDYSPYSLQPNNPTYKEKVLRFNQGEAGSRYTSQHFPDTQDYLAHTRIYDDTLEGQPTRVLQEIQSDLHQQGRQVGYDVNRVGDERDDMLALWDAADKGSEEAYEALETKAQSFGYTPGVHDLEAWVFDYLGSPIPESPMQKTWLRKGIERELVDAVNEGRSQLAIPIKGAVEQLKRGEGVQKWYETQVLNTAKKVAKQTNSDFSVVTQGTNKFTAEQLSYNYWDKLADNLNRTGEYYKLERKLHEVFDSSTVFDLFSALDASDETLFTSLTAQLSKGIEYAVIKPRGAVSATLYSSPAASAAAYLAYKQGATEQDVAAQLEAKGFDAEDIADINQDAVFIKNAVDSGYNIEEAQEYLKQQEVTVDQESQESISPVLGVPDIDPFTGRPSPEQIAGLEPEGPKAHAYSEITGEAEQDLPKLLSDLEIIHPVMTSNVTAAQSWFGNDAARRRYDFARLQARQKVVNTVKEKTGIELAWQGDSGDPLSGGYIATMPDGSQVPVDTAFWEDLKGSGFEIAGGVAGFMTGLRATPGGAYPKAAGAVVGSVLGAIGGSQVDYLRKAVELQEDMEYQAMAYKALNAGEMAVIGEAIGYPLAKGMGVGWKTLVNAKDMLVNGNTNGARLALKETLFMSDQEIDELVTNLSKVSKVPGTQKEQEIVATALTAPGVQDLVRAAGTLDSKASRAVINSVDKRAKEVLDTAASLTTKDSPQLLVQDLQNYTNDVKTFYDTVKAQAVQTPKGLNFQWDYDELAIEPVLDRLSKNITDPNVSNRYLLQAQRVRALSENRNFGDLIELRQLVNDFLYNKRIAKAPDQDMLRGIVKKIDSAIEQGAQTVMEKPDEWLNNWYEARKMYSNMKKVEQTAMYRAIFDRNGKVKPVQPETVVKALGKYVTALDGNFEQVMSKIPYKGREVYEGAVIDALAQRYTAGLQGGTQAVHFPQLLQELDKVSFTTKNARAFKRSLQELGEVFQNDVALAQTSGMMVLPKFQSYLTIDPWVRAQYEAATGIFNTVKTFAPTEEARKNALIKKTAKLLENPLDAKTSKELMNELSAEVNLTEDILKLQREAAKAKAAGQDLTSPRITIDSAGKLTRGEGEKIPMHRVATTEQLKTISDAEAVTVNSPDLDKILKQRGFVAVQSGTDRIRKLK